MPSLVRANIFQRKTRAAITILAVAVPVTAVLLVLIQLGGLGLMTFAVLVLSMHRSSRASRPHGSLTKPH